MTRFRRGPSLRVMMPTTPRPIRVVSPPVYCAGTVHAQRQTPVQLDLHRKDGPSRVALMEDGAAFCRSCAYDLERGGDSS